MRRLNKTSATTFFTILFIFSICSFISAKQKTKWKTYKNKDYKFATKFPTTPQVDEEKSRDGKSIAVQHINNNTGQMYYVSVFHSQASLEANGLSTLAVETFTQELEGALLESKDIANGKEAIISLGDDTFVIYQVHIVHDKMYQVIATTNSLSKDMSTDQYFQSFKLLK
jgi:hypothetical protein